MHPFRNLSHGAVHWGLIALLAGVMLVSGVSDVRAGTDGWTTTIAVEPGAWLTVNETVPGVNIVSSTPIAGCTLSGLNTDFITYMCDPSGAGIPAGTQLMQTFSGNSGQVGETVTYNANGPQASQPADGNSFVQIYCSALASESHPGGSSILPWVCTLPTPTQTPGGGRLYINILQSGAGVTDVTSAPSTLGSCFSVDHDRPQTLTFPILSTPTRYFAGFSNVVALAYSCPLTQPLPEGTPIEIVAETRITPANPTRGAPAVAIQEAVTARTAISSPTTQQIFGPNPPLLYSIDPASGAPGATVTLTGMGLTAFALSFGGTPGGSTPVGPSGGTTVTFGTTPATNVSCSQDGTNCTATAPALDPGLAVNVTVTNSNGTSNAVTFTYGNAATSSP